MFLILYQNISFDNLHEMSKPALLEKCQALFSGKNKKNSVNLLSAEVLISPESGKN